MCLSQVYFCIHPQIQSTHNHLYCPSLPAADKKGLNVQLSRSFQGDLLDFQPTPACVVSSTTYAWLNIYIFMVKDIYSHQK